MKKLFIAFLAVSCIFITGCGNKTLKEGTYKGTAIDNYGGEENTASAEVKIDAEGKITSVYLDTTYKGSTKKALKNEYGMKKINGKKLELYNFYELSGFYKKLKNGETLK